MTGAALTEPECQASWFGPSACFTVLLSHAAFSLSVAVSLLCYLCHSDSRYLSHFLILSLALIVFSMGFFFFSVTVTLPINDSFQFN